MRESRQGAVADLLEHSRLGEPSARVASADDSERRGSRRSSRAPPARRPRARRSPSPPTIATRSARSRSGTSGPKESVQLASPAATSARRSPGSAGKRQCDGGEVRAAVERAPELLEEHGLLDEGEARARRLPRRSRRPVQPSSASSFHDGSGFAARKALACSRSASCSGVNVKSIRQRDFGRPSTRSATMFRSTSEVPASIVFPRLLSCWCCQ